MKFCILLLCLAPSLALADIYKLIDADGHVTYSSAPMKGAKRIVMTSPSHSATGQARASNTPEDFPKINQATQKSRDDSRHKILEDELQAEQGLLNSVREQIAHLPKDGQRPGELSKQEDLHLENIAAIKAELSRLK